MMSGGVHVELDQVKLRCAACDELSFIWRRKSKLKEKNHVKHMWCANCRQVTPHVEVRDD